ncbi:MAG: flavin reductase family protein [Elusimicrobiota bacterium]|jgi:flavin reductase (DIM6/NTAB) family NADH-FMN oxidoreductase RutF|nr:flavin reductase family protein [Elusimicrobiota bacterium]
MKQMPLSKVFTLIEPGPVVLISTNHKGKNNIMTISWTMVCDFTPRFALTTGDWNYSYEALIKTKECAISIPNASLAKKAAQIGSCSGADIDKFANFKLTPLKARFVKAPLIKECFANIECKITDHIKKHNIFILDGICAWIDEKNKDRNSFHAIGDGTFVVDGRKIKNLRSIMKDKLPTGV